jgi:hypothetical protein
MTAKAVRVRRVVLLGALLIPVALVACARVVTRRLVAPEHAATLDHKSPYLKAHLRTGYVYVLREWAWSDSSRTVSGLGTLYDPDRRAVGAESTVTLPRDSVALFETNVSHLSGGAVALTVMAGVTAAIAIGCAFNPKACFGSCPTFYAPDSSGRSVLQAEGFSASIAPALEAADLDALYRARATSREFSLRLTNEALETHVIRYADLLVAPRPPNGRVFATPSGEFRSATSLTPPSLCSAPEGDCRAALVAFDERERFTAADSNNLGAQETIDLEFAHPPAGPLGLVVTARQSLMTTFLIYQALAYMGRDAGHWLASLPKSPVDTARAESIMAHMLGRIDVLVPDDSGQWRVVGQTGETGPIAPDTKLVPIPPSAAGATHIRLRLTKGLWRIDWVALASVGETVTPIRLSPSMVLRGSKPDSDALRALTLRHEPLTTLPGDEFELAYRLPEHPERLELFLEARGYYLEWMRREWMAETNPRSAARLLLDPEDMLRDLARPYKRQEATMDSLFWNSRYAKP